MHVIHRPNRKSRLAGTGVIEAVEAAYPRLDNSSWDFVVKLDGDLSFAPDYFERCLRNFETDIRLGIGGGTVCRIANGVLSIDSPGDPPFHVRGATKIYRRSCWQAIAPLTRAPGWDTIDEVKANLRGFRTSTFPDTVIVQHKPTGAADGLWRNAAKNGRANYVAGYHPLFMLAKCATRTLRSKPYFVESAALVAGYASGYWRRLPRAEPDVVRYLRQQQIRRLLFRDGIYKSGPA
jgi:hypothetical protein